MDRIAVRTTRESCIFGETSYLLSKTWGKCYGIDPWFDHIHDQKRYHMIMGINHRVKEWSRHDKQNQRHTENS